MYKAKKDMTDFMKKTVLLGLAVLVCSFSLQSQTRFNIGGIDYEATSANTVKVIESQDPLLQQYVGNIVIPDTVDNGGTKYTVTGIDEMAFFYNESLKMVTVPATVTLIGDYAFAGCDSLTDIVVIDTNLNYLSLDGVLYAKDTTVLVCYPMGKTATGFSVHDSVRVLAKGAFMRNLSLVSVVLPPLLETIGDYAFTYCEALTTLNKCDSLTALGDYAFANCGALTALNISDTLISIGEYAFAESGLLSYVVPQTVENIGRYAFFACADLTDITVDGGNLHYKDVSGVLFDYGGTVLIAYPAGKAAASYAVPSGTQVIGCGAFAQSKNTRTVTFPASLTAIEEAAFNSSGLTSVAIPASVSVIRNNAFTNCDTLSKLTIAEGVDTIEQYAFSYCYLLDTVRLPNSLKQLDTAAFYACHGLKYAKLSQSMTAVAFLSFYLCDGLTTVEFPDTLTTIEERAFAYCSSLTELVIPRKVTDIGEYAFENNTSLTEITANAENPPTIDMMTFSNVPNDIPVYVPCGRDYYYQGSNWGYFSNIFAKIPIVSVSSNNSSRGTASVTKLNTCIDSTAILTAVPASGFGFEMWNDGDTNNPRTISVYKDTSLTAVFVEQYVVTLHENNAIMGSTLGAGNYNVGRTATIEAVPAVGYRFVDWSDGSTENPRDTLVLQNVELTANFITGFTVVLTQNIPAAGVLTGAGGYNQNATVVITASANTGYRFVSWDDGNGNATRTFTLTQDTAFEAIFIATYDLLVTANYPANGIFTGGGKYDEGTPVSISAIPTAGYRFVRWDDGNTDNPRSIAVFSDTTFTAIFTSALFIDVVPNDPARGSTTGSGDYEQDSIATIEAIPNPGYRFLHWSDSVTTNPRNIIVTQDSIFTAVFIALHQLNVISADLAMGSVSGSGTFDYGSSNAIEAFPNTNFRFTHWTDGNTDNPRLVTLVKDTTFTAEFVAAYTVSVSVNDTNMGAATGEGTYVDSSFIVLTAVPKTGYRFVQWNITDNTGTSTDTLNPLDYVVTGHAAFEALFVKTYRVSLTAKDPAMGTMEGGAAYDSADIAEITAVPNYGYRFVVWNDGDTANPRTITVHQDTSFEATFIAIHNITVRSGDETKGTVSGGGDYDQGDTAIIIANPLPEYCFARWNDGDTSNPRQIVVEQSRLYTAFFAKVQTITVSVNSASMGSAIGGGVYHKDSIIEIEAFPNEGYKFAHWDDNNTDNPRQVLVTEDKTFTAVFINLFKVETFANDTNMGIVVGGGFYDQDEVAVVVAIPHSGFRFVEWTDGEDQNPRSVSVTQNMSFTAIFEVKPEDPPTNITQAQDKDGFQIYPNPVTDGMVFIQTDDEAATVVLFDAMGRKVFTSLTLNKGWMDVSHLPSGVYFVRVNKTVKKLVINNK